MANNDQNNKNGKGRNNLRGVLTLVAWALVLTVAFNYFSAYNRNTANKATSHEIKYSEMVSIIESGKAEEVLFKDDAIYLTPVDFSIYTLALALPTLPMPPKPPPLFLASIRNSSISSPTMMMVGRIYCTMNTSTGFICVS